MVLAAGGSSRLGHPKQLLSHKGRPLLRRAADAAVAAKAGPVVVVLGAHGESIRRVLVGIDVQVTINREWRNGIATSIHAGLAALGKDRQPDAALLMTCDQPHVSADLLRRMIDTYGATRPPVVACAYSGTLGTPALFDRSLFGELFLLTGDSGAKKVIEKHKGGAVRVPFELGVVDIDTPEDLGKLGIRRSGAREKL